MDTDKCGHTELTTNLHIKLPRKSHRDLLEVKVDGGTESCALSLRVYRRMFPNSLTTDGIPKSNALKSVTHNILESYTDGMLPVFYMVILEVAHFRTGELMPIRFSTVNTEHALITYTMYQAHNKGYSYYYVKTEQHSEDTFTPSKTAQQLENTTTRAAVHLYKITM